MSLSLPNLHSLSLSLSLSKVFFSLVHPNSLSPFFPPPPSSPKRNDGTYPSSCTNESLDLALLADLSDELAAKWPNVKAMSGPEHASFWGHEWSKHGTCSGLDQRAYFAAALGLLLPTPPVVEEKRGSFASRRELASGYGFASDGARPSDGGDDGAAVLVCKGGYLSEVRVCYARGGGGSAPGGGAVGGRIPCPDVILREDNCGEKIEIASFDDAPTKETLALK
jgi:ribonuclease T2